MRKLPVILLLVGIAFPAFASRRVTVEQLKEVLTTAHGKPDAEVARQLSDLELTERLSTATLSRLETDLPGIETGQALIALADLSAFLDLPVDEIPDLAKPDIPVQRQLMAQTIDYVGKTISKLPNFFATRVTIHFEDTPPRGNENGQIINTLYQPLHTVGKSSANVLYRDGQEVVDPGAAKGKKSGAGTEGLTTSGEFGPILATVLVDAAQGKLMWSHWEQGTSGPQAVFRYAIPKEKSHYQVQFCCVSGDSGSRIFQQFSGYHGEIAVDPKNGTILRLTLEAELKPTDPIVKANMLVEYGPVEIGGKTYLCPVKSVSLSQVQPLHSLLTQDPRTGNMTQDAENRPGQLQTLVNDVAFEHYHLFTASAHVLAGDNGGHGEETRVSGGVNVSKPVSNTADSEETASTSKPTGSLAAGSSMQVATAAPVAPLSSAAANATPESTAAEIRVADSTGLPDTPAAPRLASSNSSVSPQASAFLVDVEVTAYDKKNRPISGLTPNDFEVYDNGRKQAIRFFSRPSVAAMEASPKTPVRLTYSNRRAIAASAGADTADGAANVTIFLIDASNLSWDDLTYVRGQLLRFMRGLPAREHVALYVLQRHGFQVLEEQTNDHESIEAKLREWMPSSQELMRTQAEERRTQQQTDTVGNQSDLQTVSGTSSQAPNAGTLVDPALRQTGSNPEGDTLSIMVGVARHLAAIPGHKNLVWITSDKVLGGRRGRSSGIDKGNKNADELAMHAQETMNDARVSVYPLDASQPAGDVSIAVHPEADVAQTTNLPTSANMQRGPNAVEMQSDLHPIQGPMRIVADATGGHAIRRADIATALNKVVEDGHATYLLSFTPDVPADGQYHTLDVKLPSQPGTILRHRTVYRHIKEPSTLKDRFGQAIWQAFDMNEIGVSAIPAATTTGAVLKLNIAASDLAIAQQEDRWVDNLDIFLVQRDDGGLHAQITGKTLVLVLKPATYQKLSQEGVPFDQPIERNQNISSVRVVVVDENSGKMGSVTIPAAALQNNP